MRRMKKILMLVTLAFVFAMPAMAAKSDKVDVCHVIAANDVIPFGFGPVPTVDLHFGKIISVSPNAVGTHEAHDDDTVFHQYDPNPDVHGENNPIDVFRDVGFHLPAANCWIVKPLAAQ